MKPFIIRIALIIFLPRVVLVLLDQMYAANKDITNEDAEMISNAWALLSYLTALGWCVALFEFGDYCLYRFFNKRMTTSW